MVPKNFYLTPQQDDKLKRILETGKYVSQSEIFRDGIDRVAKEVGVA